MRDFQGHALSKSRKFSFSATQGKRQKSGFAFFEGARGSPGRLLPARSCDLRALPSSSLAVCCRTARKGGPFGSAHRLLLFPKSFLILFGGFVKGAHLINTRAAFIRHPQRRSRANCVALRKSVILLARNILFTKFFQAKETNFREGPAALIGAGAFGRSSVGVQVWAFWLRPGALPQFFAGECCLFRAGMV